MKAKGGRLVGGRWSLGLPAVSLLCFFFFVAGLFVSMLLSHQEVSPSLQPRILESVVQEEREFDPLVHGRTRERSLTEIPFQVLSWKPRALYFPGFAAAEQCDRIIKMAKEHLAPSSLALRKGETAENTKGIRTRHLTSCAMRLARGIIHIMMHSTHLNMAHKKARGLLLSCCIYLMLKKVEKLCSRLRMD